MNRNTTLRDLNRADLPSLGLVLDSTGLFPSDMLAPLAEPYLAGLAAHHWLVADLDGKAVALVYAEPERMTIGTFNLLAIAVNPALQGHGIGKALVAALELRLRQCGARIVIVETSGLPDYAGTREFYLGQSFTEEARIRDFYDHGEDKVVYWKSL